MVEGFNLRRNPEPREQPEVSEAPEVVEMPQEAEPVLAESNETGAASLEYLRERYYEVFGPLVDAYKSNPKTRPAIQKALMLRNTYRQQVSVLEKQRPLAET